MKYNKQKLGPGVDYCYIYYTYYNIYTIYNILLQIIIIICTFINIILHITRINVLFIIVQFTNFNNVLMIFRLIFIQKLIQLPMIIYPKKCVGTYYLRIYMINKTIFRNIILKQVTLLLSTLSEFNLTIYIELQFARNMLPYIILLYIQLYSGPSTVDVGQNKWKDEKFKGTKFHYIPFRL